MKTNIRFSNLVKAAMAGLAVGVISGAALYSQSVAAADGTTTPSAQVGSTSASTPTPVTTTPAASTTAAKTTTTTPAKTTPTSVKATTTTPVTTGIVKKSGVIKLTGTTSVHEGAGLGYKVTKKLKAGTSWKYFATKDYQGYIWYQVGGTQWVPISKTAAKTPAAPVKTPAKTPVASAVVAKKGVIKMPINEPVRPGAGLGYNTTGKILKAGTSWKYSAVRDYEGYNWYNVGKNQWVGIKKGTVAIKTPVKVTTVSGVVYHKGTVRLNANRALQAGPGKGYKVIRTLKYGSSWHFTATRVYQGLTWYNVGKNQWVSVNKNTLDWHGPSEVDVAYPNLNSYANVWVSVSLSKQRVYLMSGNKVLYTMLCSTGRPGATTPKGTYAIQAERGPVFGGSLGGARYYVSWKDHGVYLFHSIPIGGNGAYLASEGALLGKVAHSHGCIRLSVSDAYWMYTHIKYGTKVVIK